MTLRRTAQMALVVGCAFAGGWMAATTSTGVTGAMAQTAHDQVDPNIVALFMGLATLSVDTESATERTNALGDRLAALERRVQQLETRR